MCQALLSAGFSCTAPQGAYYVMADFAALSDRSDEDFAVWLTRDVGVAPVPGSSFYHDASGGRTTVRFAFCKTIDLLEQAAERLKSVRTAVG